MIQLCYISTARPTVTAAEVDQILAVSRVNNQRVGVTGMMLFNGKRFLQLLEGEREAVNATYDRIKRDPRHYALVKLSERGIDDREFGRWDMAFERFLAERPALDAQVAALTTRASANVKALFSSYAAM